MFLELLNYDLEGVALNSKSAIVDAVYLNVSVKRRAETEDDGPDGPATPLRIVLATLDPSAKTALLAAYQTIEDVVRGHAATEYAAKVASPQALDEKIAAAAAAEKQLAELHAQIETKRAELNAKE